MKKILQWFAVLSLTLTTVACNFNTAPGENAAPYGTTNRMYDQNTIPYDTRTGYDVTGNRVGGVTGFGGINNYGYRDNRGYNNYSYYQRYGAAGNTGYGTMNRNTGISQFARDGQYGRGPVAEMNRQQIGHARVNARELQGRGTAARNTHIYVDRDVLAQLVANVVASVPGINSASVAVTDEEILVGIQTGNNNRNGNMANMGNNAIGRDNNNNKQNLLSAAKKSAISVSPSYFKVYVTADNRLFTRINRLGTWNMNNLNTMNGNGNQSPQNDEVNRLIQDMRGKS